MSNQRWSKVRAEKWIRDFSTEHEMVPSSSVRKKYGGPPDKELIRHWGGVRKALEDSGAPLCNASIGGGLQSFDHSAGVLTGLRERNRRWRDMKGMQVSCTLCDWSEWHETGSLGLQAQKKHVEAHGIERPKRQRWKNKKSQMPPGGEKVPGAPIKRGG